MKKQNFVPLILTSLLLTSLCIHQTLGGPKFVQTAPPKPKTEKAADSPGKNTSTEEKLSLKSQLAKLRGKMLYKRNQVRKAEAESLATNNTLRIKAEQLEQERRLLFIADNPEIRQLYQELDFLEAEVEKYKKN